MIPLRRAGVKRSGLGGSYGLDQSLAWELPYDDELLILNRNTSLSLVQSLDPHRFFCLFVCLFVCFFNHGEKLT